MAYYQNLYTSSGTSSDFAEICSVIPNIVSQEENTSLTAIPKANEIKATVFSMDSHSAPGPDGFSGSFYQSCWDIIGADVVNSVQQFFSQGYLLPNLNSNFIVLIPKEPGANEISKFGPIGLENFIFKIILKILANRLGKFITRILSPQQTAFIKGRSIVESIGMVSENVNLLDRKNLGGNLGLKLDIKKTFDSLEWNFLLHVLRCFGFSETFIKWVHTLLHSTKLSILINGCPCGFFSCSRGVRQGDPLSPLLVCLAKDVLSRGLTNLHTRGLVKPISSPRDCTPPSHCLYANDVFVFTRGDVRSLNNLMCFLDCYSRSSGQYINKDKSFFYSGSHAFKENISSNLSWDSKKAHFLSIIWEFLSLKVTPKEYIFKVLPIR